MLKKKNKITILIVEDDPSLLRLYKIKLDKTGYNVKTVSDGSHAFETAKAIKPDIILLDIILPKLDGFSILKKLKADNQTKKIPVILLTNLGQDEDIEKGKKLGANDYLIKANFTPAEVVSKMENLWNKH